MNDHPAWSGNVASPRRDFTAPWADEPHLVVDLTAEEPLVRLAEPPDAPVDSSALDFISPWADRPGAPHG